MYGEKADIRGWLGEGIRGDLKAIISMSGEVLRKIDHLCCREVKDHAHKMARKG